MDRATALAFLNEWNEMHNQTEAAFKMMSKACGMTADSPVGLAMWKCFELYTDLLEDKLNPDSVSHWLDWFCWDNDMGVRGLEVSINKGPMIPIRNLEDLADICLGYKETTNG